MELLEGPRKRRKGGEEEEEGAGLRYFTLTSCVQVHVVLVHRHHVAVGGEGGGAGPAGGRVHVHHLKGELQ